jgi:hypothetical protein
MPLPIPLYGGVSPVFGSSHVELHDSGGAIFSLDRQRPKAGMNETCPL